MGAWGVCDTHLAIFARMTHFVAMTTLTLDLPEALTAELDAAVEAGWFTSQAEAVRAAVRDMMSHRKLALLEKQQLADIDWAVSSAAKRP
jgi:Arc/MetJ-type ribon-helix-helix transcriptional regulator